MRRHLGVFTFRRLDHSFFVFYSCQLLDRFILVFCLILTRQRLWTQIIVYVENRVNECFIIRFLKSSGETENLAVERIEICRGGSFLV